MLRACFVMEQHLGHMTYYQNIRRFVDEAPQVAPTWVPVTYLPRIGFLPKSLQGSLRGAQQVRAGLRHAKADVVFFNTQVPAALAGGLLRAAPYVVATDITPIQYDALGALYNHAPDRPGLMASYKKRINSAVFRGAARLLPWSSWARDSMVTDYGVDPARATVLPPGVDLNLWHPAPKGDVSPVRILFVGADFDRKGGPRVMQAFQALQSGTAELHLVTRSPVPNAPGVIVHRGMQPNSPELIALYQSCDVFVLPTGAEAFGIAAAEASASGLPVVATRTGGLVDIVADGETGYLIPPGDDAALLQQLRNLTANAELRQDMARAARARAEVHFDARKNAEKLLACLADVAAVTKAIGSAGRPPD
ncbi:MAG: glycosyltransferase family 4 protein [Hyphomicrobiaceae bacterium]